MFAHKPSALDSTLEILEVDINKEISWGKAEFVKFDNKILHELINDGQDGYLAVLRVHHSVLKRIYDVSIVLDNKLLLLSSSDLVNAIVKKYKDAVDELNDLYVKSLLQDQM